MKHLPAFSTTLMLSALAHAEAAPAAPSAVSQIVPLAIIFGIFYFLLIRPQQKKQKLHLQFLSELKKGDMVVTNGGIIGTIRNLSEKFVTLEIDDGVCMKMLRAQILEGANSLKEESKAKS